MNLPSRAGEILCQKNGLLICIAEITGRDDAVFWELSQEIPAEADRSALVDLWIRCLDGQYVLLRANVAILESSDFATIIWGVAEKRDVILAQTPLHHSATLQTVPASTLRTENGQTWVLVAAERAGTKFILLNTEAEFRNGSHRKPTALPDAPHKHAGYRRP
ncbi:MAG: hypothetical protein JNM18_25480 [Planctomycetaceae bacterium]|nr:hypothetical protein [Planctomycetaceae bacterium]